jgi:hypothetical protein
LVWNSFVFAGTSGKLAVCDRTTEAMICMRGAKLQERRFTITVGKTKDKWRETCYAV